MSNFVSLIDCYRILLNSSESIKGIEGLRGHIEELNKNTLTTQLILLMNSIIIFLYPYHIKFNIFPYKTKRLWVLIQCYWEERIFIYELFFIERIVHFRMPKFKMILVHLCI